MEDYSIKTLCITAGERYSWEAAVRLSLKSTIVVKAPAKSGKTFLCRDEIFDFINCMDPDSNILYYSSKSGEADRVAYGAEIMLNSSSIYCDTAKDRTRILENQKSGNMLLAPESVESLAKILASGYRFQEIILDDAEGIAASMIHTALLKAKVDNAKLLVIGTEEDVPDDKKSLFTWLMNSPGADAYRVHRYPPLSFEMPDHIKRDTESLAEYFRKFLSSSPLEVA